MYWFLMLPLWESRQFWGVRTIWIDEYVKLQSLKVSTLGIKADNIIIWQSSENKYIIPPATKKAGYFDTSIHLATKFLSRDRLDIYQHPLLYTSIDRYRPFQTGRVTICRISKKNALAAQSSEQGYAHDIPPAWSTKTSLISERPKIFRHDTYIAVWECDCAACFSVNARWVRSLRLTEETFWHFGGWHNWS